MHLENLLAIDPDNLAPLEHADPHKKRLAAWWIVLTQDAEQPNEITRQMLTAAQEAKLQLITALDNTDLAELLNAGQIGQPFNLPYYRDEEELINLLETEYCGPLRIEGRDHRPSLSEKLEADRLTQSFPIALLYEKQIPDWAEELPQLFVGIEAAANLYPQINPLELQTKTLS
jgi:hypothetical protein